MYVKREQYLSKIRRYYDSNLIKVLTGIRRCGKSVILEQIKEEVISNGLANVDHVISMNFEDLKFEKYTTADKLNKAILKNIKDEDFSDYKIVVDDYNEIINPLEPVYFNPNKSQNVGINDFFPSLIPSLEKL